MSSRTANIPVPSECGDMIRTRALVAVNTSGGKDSQAMTILLSRIVPHGQLVAVHAPLGEVEWHGTVEHIQRHRHRASFSRRSSPSCDTLRKPAIATRPVRVVDRGERPRPTAPVRRGGSDRARRSLALPIPVFPVTATKRTILGNVPRPTVVAGHARQARRHR